MPLHSLLGNVRTTILPDCLQEQSGFFCFVLPCYIESYFLVILLQNSVTYYDPVYIVRRKDRFNCLKTIRIFFKESVVREPFDYAQGEQKIRLRGLESSLSGLTMSVRGFLWLTYLCRDYYTHRYFTVNNSCNYGFNG